MKRIPLRARDGRVRAYALVDDGDYLWLNQWRWHLSAQGYAARSVTERGKRRCVLMHRQILGLTSGDEGDHRHGERLDNRRHKLRITTPDQNKQNIAPHADNPSGHRGVSWAPHVRLWRGRVHHDGKTYDCGYHETTEDAAVAVSLKRRELMTHSEEARHAVAK